MTCIVILTCPSKSFHLLDVVNCFLLSGGFVFVFPPTRFSSSPSPFATQVCLWTSVLLISDRCPLSSKQNLISGKFLHYKHDSSFTLVHSQTHTLEARLWEVSQPFPHFQKRSVAALLALFSAENAHEFSLAANVGPKAQ